MAEPNAPQHETVLDVTAERIARTYAQGFLGAVAYDSAALEDLEAVQTEILAAHPAFAEAMRSAFIDHETRVAMIDRVIGSRVQPAVANLLKVLSAHGRIEIAGEVTRQARKLYDTQQGRLPVLVRLAREADPTLLDEIKKAVWAKEGVEPLIRVEVDPELVGGLEIRVRDTVFDGTLRTAFKVAHKAIVDETVQAIESQPERFTLAE